MVWDVVALEDRDAGLHDGVVFPRQRVNIMSMAGEDLESRLTCRSLTPYCESL